jgi:hypothetical protein
LRHGTAVESDAGEEGGQSRKGNRAHVYPEAKALFSIADAAEIRGAEGRR